MRCGTPVSGQYVRALDAIFHLKCFTCTDCGESVTSKFFPCNDGNGKMLPVCEKDYFRRMDLLCFVCKQPMLGDYITASNRRYHIEHFTCSVCASPFGQSDSYYEHNSDIYCQYHYSVRYAVRCIGCKAAVLKQYVEITRNAVEENWHPSVT